MPQNQVGKIDRRKRNKNECIHISNELVTDMKSIASMLNNYQYMKVNESIDGADSRYRNELERMGERVKKNSRKLKEECNINSGYNSDIFEDAITRPRYRILDEYDFHIDYFNEKACDVARWTLTQLDGWE